MDYPHHLSGLTTREAIIDALYRAMIGFDKYDVSMFNSAFAEDVVVEPRSRLIPTINGLPDLRSALLDRVGPMDSTHAITNVRVDVKDGADTASLTAYVMAQHCPPGTGTEHDGPKYLGGGEYGMELVRMEDGLWKIKKWTPQQLWGQGDASIVEPPK
jgi:ketosteroid isomerase-like protein